MAGTRTLTCFLSFNASEGWEVTVAPALPEWGRVGGREGRGAMLPAG